MKKKLLVLFLALALVVAFSLPVLAQDTIAGKIQALDKVRKKITIGGTEYGLSDEAAQATFKVGEAVEATVEGNARGQWVSLLCGKSCRCFYHRQSPIKGQICPGENIFFEGDKIFSALSKGG